MRLSATDRTGKTHTGQGIKHFLISEDTGAPLLMVKETVIGDLINYKVLRPGDEEFSSLAKQLGYTVQTSELR